MLSKGITLRGIEVFRALAESGSVAQAAEVTGLSQPAVSQQLKNLENALNVELLDHSKRPMQLTAAGRTFLTRADTVLSEIQLAQSELTVMDLAHISTLKMGIIDDFDNDLTPRLVTSLAERLSDSQFTFLTAPSTFLIDAVQSGELHIAITATSDEPLEKVVKYPIVNDPFIMVTPNSMPEGVDLLQSDLPFLRYDSSQLISKQIASHLANEDIQLGNRFEIGSHLALMACVASGLGWTITTPLGLMRAARYDDQVKAHPLPFTPFSRRISLLASLDWTDGVPKELAERTRRLVERQLISPAVRNLSFLKGDLRVISEM